MIYRELGNTGLQVSAIGIGTEYLDGKPYERVEEVIHAAAKAGINMMDLFMPGEERLTLHPSTAIWTSPSWTKRTFLPAYNSTTVLCQRREAIASLAAAAKSAAPLALRSSATWQKQQKYLAAKTETLCGKYHFNLL